MMDGGWSKYSNTAGSYSISWTPASSTRWLSNWIVTPIFLLGYRPLTFARPPPTWRDGPDDRTESMIERVCAGMASRWNHNNRSSWVSTVASCAAATRQNHASDASALQQVINTLGGHAQRCFLTAASRASPSSGPVGSAARLPSSDPALDGRYQSPSECPAPVRQGRRPKIAGFLDSPTGHSCCVLCLRHKRNSSPEYRGSSATKWNPSQPARASG